MFGEPFIINPETVESDAQRIAIQRIAADALRAAGIHVAEYDCTPYDILASMPHIDPDGEAKVRMMSVIAGLGDIALEEQ